VSGRPVYLLLFGTGLRRRSELANVKVSVGGVAAQVAFAGAQLEYVGLDQLNVFIPSSLAGRGAVEISLTVDGRAANTTTINIK
jgi:uncharacterized protein (TIGR03437 family)